MSRDPSIPEPRVVDPRVSRQGASGGVGPFLTWARAVRADGGILLRTSRRHRKGLAPLVVTPAQRQPGAGAPPDAPVAAATAIAAIRHEWSHLWAPQRLGWWIAVLFMIGSALFMIGGAKGTWPEVPPDTPFVAWIDPSLTGWVFFAGSLFFTAAAWLQWLEALNSDVGETASASPSGPGRWRLTGWRPRNLGWLAAAVQLAGTLLFNANTGDALIQGLGWRSEDALVWTPDMVGSICFLVASQAALMEISHHYWSWQPKSLSWWIAAINMLGSILFMVSAVASLVEPGLVEAAPWLSNFTTLAGAACFLVGAYLLIPELFEAQA